MAQFTKRIVRPGKYRIKKGDEEIIENLTRSRLKKMVDNSNKMLSKGIKIPAPLAHFDLNKKTPGPFRIKGSDSLDAKTGEPIGWRSDLNGGFWKSFELRDDGLYGTVEVPGNKSDTNSLAYKVANTIKETSIFSVPDYVDQDGETYDGDTLFHVALVTTPVEPGQPNFIAQDDLATAMAFSMADEVDPNKSSPPSKDGFGKSKDGKSKGGEEISSQDQDSSLLSGACTVEDAIAALSSLGLVFPEDTDNTNFVERVCIVARQKQADSKGGDPNDSGSTTTPPSNPQVKPTSVAMSKDITQETLDAVVKVASDTKKASLSTRAAALKARVNPEFYASDIEAQLNSFAMSLDQLTAVHPLETTISLLERALPKVEEKKTPPVDDPLKKFFMSNIPSEYTVQSNPDDQTADKGDLSTEDEARLIAML